MNEEMINKAVELLAIIKSEGKVPSDNPDWLKFSIAIRVEAAKRLEASGVQQTDTPLVSTI